MDNKGSFHKCEAGSAVSWEKMGEQPACRNATGRGVCKEGVVEEGFG
jgi:hypothetical protein